MKETRSRTITHLTICAAIIAVLSFTHLAWGQAEQVQGGPEKGAVARILAGAEEGKISKEKAAEMIAALSKGMDQGNQEEDPDLKEMLEDYWKEDPSFRAGYAMRIEMYLQHMAAGQGRDDERADQRRDERIERDERPLSPAVARLHREVGSYDFTVRINMDAVGQAGVFDLQGSGDSEMILQGQFLLRRSLQESAETVSVMGGDPGDPAYFSLSMDGDRTRFGYTVGSMEDADTLVMKDPYGDMVIRTTFDESGGSTTSVFVGPQQAEFLAIASTRARRQPISVLETMLSSPIKPMWVNSSTNSPDPVANFSPEHLTLQKLAGDFEAASEESKARSRMICQGRFLVSQRSVQDHDTVTFTGFDSARKVFQHIILDPRVPGFRYFEGTRQEDGVVVFTARDGQDDSSTVMLHDDGGYTVTYGNQAMRFRPVVEEQGQEEAQGEARGLTDESIWKLIEHGAGAEPAIERGEMTKEAAIEHLRTQLQRLDIGRRGAEEPSTASAGEDAPEKGAVTRILAGADAGKISKEKAAEMVAALNRSSEQEDPDLKQQLEMYWKIDPSMRAGYAMRIETYLQMKAAEEHGGQEKRPPQGEARGLTDESIWKLIEGGIRVKTAVENGEVTRDKAIELYRGYMEILRAVESSDGQSSNAREDRGEPEEDAILQIVTGVAEGKISREKAAEMIASLNKDLGIPKDDPTIHRQLEMAMEFKGSPKWFAQAIEKYIEKTKNEGKEEDK